MPNPVNPVSLIHGVSGSTVFVNTPDQKIQQWDAATGAVRRTFDPPRRKMGRPNRIVKAIMSSDEKTVAIISTGTVSFGARDLVQQRQNQSVRCNNR